MVAVCFYSSFHVEQAFDPSSPLVSYKDRGHCGPRGDDAAADLSSCSAGASKVIDVPNKAWAIVATVNGCEYFAYTIYKCDEAINRLIQSTVYVFIVMISNSPSRRPRLCQIASNVSPVSKFIGF